MEVKAGTGTQVGVGIISRVTVDLLVGLVSEVEAGVGTPAEAVVEEGTATVRPLPSRSTALSITDGISLLLTAGYDQRGGPSHQGPPNGQYGHPPPTAGSMPPPSGPRSTNGSSSQPPPSGPRGAPSLPPSTAVDNSADLGPDYDADAIKARYLGGEAHAKKRKLRKTNDKKFVFDWEAEEDTASSAGLIGSGIMFGGSRAGMGGGRGVDESEREHSASGGPKKEDQFADELERRSAKKSGGDDRHWTEKKLEEMKDRDWRIFREDFSIAARGA